MRREIIIYLLYAGLLAIFLGGAFLAPVLSLHGDPAGEALYDIYGRTCHQKLSRSQCVFRDSNSTPVGDCTPQSGIYVSEEHDHHNYINDSSDVIGYKIAVCARDVGIYGFMLLAVLAYPLAYKLDNKKIPPAIWLVLAIVPLGLDGTLQLVSSLGMFGLEYESTNLIRLITGGFAGAAVTIYGLPVLNRMFN